MSPRFPHPPEGSGGSQNDLLKDGLFAYEVVAESAAMRQCLDLVDAAADVDAPVMMLGEQGTGKKYLAAHMHRLSSRRTRPHKVVLCEEFAEGEVSRQFTGGIRHGTNNPFAGFLTSTGGGSVTLADMERMPVGLQKELYAFLSRYDVGGDSGPRLGVRLFSTIRTVVDSSDRVFSEELLGVVGEVLIRVPALRQRREDIPRLAQIALERAIAEVGRGVKVFSHGAMDFLLHYDFPGNVSELDRLVYRGVRWATGESIFREDFGLGATAGDGENLLRASDRILPTLTDMERRHVHRVLMHTGWKRRAAAHLLGISETQLNRKIRLYGFERDDRV